MMHPADGDPESALAKARYQKIRSLLENEKLRIFEELKNYPQPIAACDVQFGHLLEQRDGILREIARLWTDDGLSRSMERLDEFARASCFLDET